MNCQVFPCESWICNYVQSMMGRKELQDVCLKCPLQWRRKRTHPVEHICPTLEGDTLEDGEHGLAEVVEAGDSPLGSFPLTPAFCSIRAVEDSSAWRWILHHVTWPEVMRAWILISNGINASFNVSFLELSFYTSWRIDCTEISNLFHFKADND